MFIGANEHSFWSFVLNSLGLAQRLTMLGSVPTTRSLVNPPHVLAWEDLSRGVWVLNHSVVGITFLNDANADADP
jgi:hypothetical protein